jgi:hypothetical protein
MKRTANGQGSAERSSQEVGRARPSARLGEQLAFFEQASTDTEVTQLGADRGLTGEYRGVSSFK